MSEKIRILLVDDHTLFRESLGQLLAAEADMVVVRSVGDADAAIRSALELNPDVILMDIDMPGLICFDAADQILRMKEQSRIIFLSAFFHDHYIEQALRVKARGYLTKSEPSHKVIEAIRQVAAGRVYFSPQVASRIIADETGVHLQDKKTRAAMLTEREVEVLRYLARGMAKKEIAATMHVSVKTVEGHAQKLMDKLDIHDRVELARYAIREGLAEA
ncbi:MAG: response regulator transcription factor [Phycisphaeraceae bacterium]